MKIKIFSIYTLLFATSSLIQAQEAETKGKPFNPWSVEVNVGQNKAVRPFSSGYYSSNPEKYFNFSGVDHFDVGVRYMLSNAFGLKLDFAQDKFNEQSGSGSLAFDTQLNRVGIQGVINLGRLLHFESFTSRVGLLAHGGVHVSQFSVNQGINSGVTEDNGGVMFGVTPQVRLAKWLVFTADFTAINNVRQHLNWDGASSSAKDNLSGMLYNTSIGVTVYLGKKEKHADWYTDTDKLKDMAGIDTDARKRLNDIETLMNDTDKDGVPDYLDAENNTPSGVAVDTRGRFIDVNKNGTPDEMEPREIIDTYSGGTNTINNSIVLEKDAIALLIDKGYVNIFFDVNKDVPNAGSTNNVYYIVRFLRSHPEAKIILNGYADKRGDEQNNLALSERRVQKVYDLLVASGIDATRIQINANGVDSEAVDSALGYNLARRVSVTIIK